MVFELPSNQTGYNSEFFLSVHPFRKLIKLFQQQPNVPVKLTILVVHCGQVTWSAIKSAKPKMETTVDMKYIEATYSSRWMTIYHDFCVDLGASECLHVDVGVLRSMTHRPLCSYIAVILKTIRVIFVIMYADHLKLPHGIVPRIWHPCVQ